MRTTVTLDDELVKKAAKYSGINEKSRLVNHVLERFIQGEAARRLLLLEGTMPGLAYPERGPRMGREPLERTEEYPSDREDG